MPSFIMVKQNGQADTTVSAFEFSTSLILSIFISAVPFSDSLKICAPPAPQHYPFSLFLFISIRFFEMELIIDLGAS